jgi:hypothetical protein
MGKVEWSVIEQARQKALELLLECITPYGFRASAQLHGYPQIWARDSVITFLGAVASQENQLIITGRNSLETLGAHQSPMGLIPLNVNPDTGYVSTENSGAMDSNLYFILGHYLYYKVTGDLEFLKKSWKRINCAMNWLLYQDMNECGLLEIPEAGNWMDLFSVRYNTLYDNVLYYASSLAYQELSAVLPTEDCNLPVRVQPANIHERLNLLFWIDRCWVAEHFAEHLEKLKAIRLEWFMLYHNIGTISSRPFYLPWVAFREYGDYCDSLGNILAILTGIADGHRTEHILRYMRQVGIDHPYPTKAIHPPVYPGESNWREYYRSRNLNLPHQYHNGGIWPMVGGFHVAALVSRKWMDEAEILLGSLAEGNRQGIEGEWEFNEWMHGESGRPMGYVKQAWSAAAYLYAEQSVRCGILPLFDDLLKAKPVSARQSEQNEIFTHPGGGPVTDA